MFSGLTIDQISHADFKEDSVRELIIVPILNRLGYTHNGVSSVSRSKTLSHPLIRVGTRNHPVKTIPDYTLLVDGKPLFVLDAKSPCEDILDPKHIQQAYSYAIHPEVNCREFGLCNGKSLVTFSTNTPDPTLHINFDDFESRWEDIVRILKPDYLRTPERRRFDPDFGTALIRMGVDKEVDHHFLGLRLNLFAKISEGLYTANTGCDFAGRTHCATFDFHESLLDSIFEGLPDPLKSGILDALHRAPFQAAAGLHVEIDAQAKLGVTTKGATEEFVPLIIREVSGSRFIPDLGIEPPQDIPDHIYQLHKQFKIREA